MSEATIIALISGITATVALIITSVLSYFTSRRADKISEQVKTVVAVAEVAASKQDQLLEKTEVIHAATNGGLEKIRAEFKEEIAGLKAELKESQAKSLSLAESASVTRPGDTK